MSGTPEIEFAAFELAAQGVVADFAAGLSVVADHHLDDAVEGLSLPSATRFRELSIDGVLRFSNLLGQIRGFLCEGSNPKVVTQVAGMTAAYIAARLSDGTSCSTHEAEAFGHFVLHLGLERVCHDFPGHTDPV